MDAITTQILMNQIAIMEGLAQLLPARNPAQAPMETARGASFVALGILESISTARKVAAMLAEAEGEKKRERDGLPELEEATASKRFATF